MDPTTPVGPTMLGVAFSLQVAKHLTARSKMVMFGSGTKFPSKSDVHFIESQIIKGVNKGREQL